MVYQHSTQHRKFESLIAGGLGALELFTGKNYSLECIPNISDIDNFFGQLIASDNECHLIKLGVGDGSYYIPDDLIGVANCISPGFGDMMTFEQDLFKKFGICSTIIDPIVPNEEYTGIRFLPFYLDTYRDPVRKTISLDEVIECEEVSSEEDLILQMDIEGNEWIILRTISIETLKRFRIIVLELHSLPIVRDKFIFEKIVQPTINKLLGQFKIVYSKAHNPSGTFTINSKTWYPDTLEVTLLRKDR